jgi:Raf kinase inhibitor-like YbhB/YbcL family protein
MLLEVTAMTLVLNSTAFAPNASIPNVYTCEGKDLSPPLAWSGAPDGTKSFVLIVDDPDAPDPKAPKLTWVHWVIYNIPATATSLAEDEKKQGVPKGTLPALNDWKKTGYGGPCPPIGRHRYFHKLYALDTVLPDLKQPIKAQVLDAMKGHVLAETQLIGTYQKGQ